MNIFDLFARSTYTHTEKPCGVKRVEGGGGAPQINKNYTTNEK